MRVANICGTYLHGWMEAPEVRSLIAKSAGIQNHQPCKESWSERRQKTYTKMADHIEEHLNLDPVKRYLGV
jgi:adenosylcobyric acid synthase